MTDDNEVARLLQANLEAQNRTTHAVRAFVRFLFIQFLAVTIASVLAYFSVTLEIPALAFVASLVLLTGIIWASNAGWTELGLSDRFAAARAEAEELGREQAEAQRTVREAEQAEQVEREAERTKAAEIERAQAAAARRQKWKSLVATKRFRIWSALAFALIIGSATVWVASAVVQNLVASIQSAEVQARFSEDSLAAIDSCAISAGVNAAMLPKAYSITNLTLSLRNDSGPGFEQSDSFVECVIKEVTGSGSAGLQPGDEREHGSYTVLRSTSDQYIRISPIE